MKRISLIQIIKVAMVAGVLVMSWLSYPNLPDKMPMHWNLEGEVDNYWPKEKGVLVIPTISMLMLMGFALLPSVDPKKKKYRLFKTEWEIIQVGLLGFMTYISGVTLYAAGHPNINVGTLIMVGTGALFILMGNYLSKIRQNWFIGIKTPWTLASEDNWNKTHRFASWCFVVAGVVILTGVSLGLLMPVLLIGGIILASLLPLTYSFLLFKKQERLMKPVLAGLMLVLLLMMALRLVTGEDNWICQNGRWVAHGNPSAAMPVDKCR